MKPWRTLASRTVLKDKFLTLRTDRCERDDGHIVPAYHVLEFSPWVTVVPLTDAGNVVLVREYRHAAGVLMLGLPGGVSDPGETSWEAVGRRELAEETGYVPREMHLIGSCFPNPAVQNNFVHFYLGLGCAPTVAQDFDGNEDIEIVEMPLRKFLNYEQAEHQHAIHAAALFYLLRYFLKHPELAPK
jgi:ADP-ribose pyrophosphatase